MNTTAWFAAGVPLGAAAVCRMLTLSGLLASGFSMSVGNAHASEAEDGAEALGQLDQSYAFHGLRTGHRSAIVAGSSFGDAPDRAAGDGVVRIPPGSRLQPGSVQILVVTPPMDSAELP